MNPIEHARQLNATPLSACLNRDAVAEVVQQRPLIFSDTRIFVADEHLRTMAELVAAMERVVILPGWRDRVLPHHGDTARHASNLRGVFYGYDFHFGDDGPKLIEINTNAGGGPLNALLLGAQQGERAGMADGAAVEAQFVDMFVSEWRLGGSDGLPGLVAIVDDQPTTQYLHPDFELLRAALERRGIAALICDPAELSLHDGRLQHGARKVDMVYNRLTDFLLQDPAHAILRRAWLTDAALITPHPRAYALYADKRNLALLGDTEWLTDIGVDAATRALLSRVVPHTERVTADNAEDIRARRKKLFFKPANGYGSKAAYRGLNVTTRVFGEILAGDYVAQTLVPAAERTIIVDGEPTVLKFDLRCYAYAGVVQMVAARLWQGQTTNFRTIGGGFTPVARVT
jgi:glutathione synthase/RimK-type ligase-like ATP-grasp enzyme